MEFTYKKLKDLFLIEIKRFPNWVVLNKVPGK